MNYKAIAYYDLRKKRRSYHILECKLLGIFIRLGCKLLGIFIASGVMLWPIILDESEKVWSTFESKSLVCRPRNFWLIYGGDSIKEGMLDLMYFVTESYDKISRWTWDNFLLWNFFLFFLRHIVKLRAAQPNVFIWEACNMFVFSWRKMVRRAASHGDFIACDYNNY